jgi:hypothetical protein
MDKPDHPLFAAFKKGFHTTFTLGAFNRSVAEASISIIYFYCTG